MKGKQIDLIEDIGKGVENDQLAQKQPLRQKEEDHEQSGKQTE